MNTSSTQAHPGTTLDQEQTVLLAAVDALLAPLAQLCLAKGLTVQAVEERLRVAFVQSAVGAHGHLPAQRLTSRISASTGLTRREVSRLQALDLDPAAHRKPRPSFATELFTRWACEPSLQGPDGRPVALPRLGPPPSFEHLAQSVTQDIHPRSLLDELCRLGLATCDLESDRVRLLKDAFVPRGDWARMTGFLADNVGDHLRSASVNVLGSGKEHLEQSIFADELSVQSLQAFRDLMAAQWQRMLKSVVPRLEQLIEADRHAGRVQNQRVRVGLFTWSQPMSGPTRHLALVPQTASITPLRRARPKDRS
ncbi:MAG: DUF6502 family protein [Pseudomonadota bacterium]|nr:DUF6502 family protein [Pseudomonadota bacterium]